MAAVLTGKQKASIFLLALGVETSSQVLNFLEEFQIEEIAREIARLGTVESETMNVVMKEFHELMLTEVGVKGGMGYLREVLEKTLGSTRAMSLLNRLSEVQPFTYLKEMPASQLAAVLAKEHPQTIAVVLSYIPPALSAAVLSQMPEQTKLEIALRIANAKFVETETVRDINKALEKTMLSQKFETVGVVASAEQFGAKSLAEILNRTDRATEASILENLQKTNTTLSEEVRKQMFLFEDIASLDDRALQRIMREVDSKDLTLVLKLADERVKEKIFKNMSERARDILQEEIGYLGPVRIRQVEEAQQKILETIRRLEQAGEIVIPKGGVEEKFV